MGEESGEMEIMKYIKCIYNRCNVPTRRITIIIIDSYNENSIHDDNYKKRRANTKSNIEKKGEKEENLIIKFFELSSLKFSTTNDDQDSKVQFVDVSDNDNDNDTNFNNFYEEISRLITPVVREPVVREPHPLQCINKFISINLLDLLEEINSDDNINSDERGEWLYKSIEKALSIEDIELLKRRGDVIFFESLSNNFD